MRIVFIFTALLTLIACNGESVDPLDDRSSTLPLTSGIDTVGMDFTVRPQEDLFGYANGNWLLNTEIPEDKSSWGSFNILHEKSLEQLRVIIEEAAIEKKSSAIGNAEAGTKIGAFFRAWLNEDETERRQLTPIANELAAINEVKSFDDILTLFSLYNAIGIDSPLNFWVGQDDKDSTRYVVYLTQSGLGLPDRDYYFDDTDRGREIVAQYKAFIAKLLLLANMAENSSAAMEAAARIFKLEKTLAQHQWTRVENRDSEKTYNKKTTVEVRELLGAYDFDRFTTAMGIANQGDYIIRQPTYLAALKKLANEADLESWQDYLRFNILVSYAPYMAKSFENAHFGFYNQTLDGQPEQQARWKLAVNSINGNMGELLGQLYVAKHFPPEAKARMTGLVDNLIEAYRASISALDWMGPETKEKALAKLALFTPKIGYPDKWKDYSSLLISDTDLVGNIKRARLFNHQLQLDKLGEPVDRSEWFMAPQRVNAYYNPGLNEIVFPAGILQPPFFNLHADDAVNYGAIGGVIGHEIGHGFDDQGSKYTGEGNLQNWWTEADRKNFEQRAARLVKQYASYQPLPDLSINGELTLGENIGDLGGLSVALQAYLLSLKDQTAPEFDGFSGPQRVFLGWAQAWRVKRREELTERLLKTDPHSPPRYRVNGVVPNIDAFYAAFDVQPGDSLYFPPEQRVKIW